MSKKEYSAHHDDHNHDGAKIPSVGFEGPDNLFGGIRNLSQRESGFPSEIERKTHSAIPKRRSFDRWLRGNALPFGIPSGASLLLAFCSLHIFDYSKKTAIRQERREAMPYLYLSASSGSMFAARREGKIPVMKPMAVEKTIMNATNHGGS